MSLYLLELTGDERDLLLTALMTANDPDIMQIRRELADLQPNQGIVISGPADIDPDLLEVCSARPESVPVVWAIGNTRVPLAPKVDASWVRRVMRGVEIDRQLGEFEGRVTTYLEKLRETAGQPQPDLEEILRLLLAVNRAAVETHQSLAIYDER